MQLIVDIAEMRSLNKAAASIGLSQPAATHALAEFELALGGPIFERHARGMRPTVMGAALLPLVRNALRLMQAGADAVSFLQVGATGIVRIGATGTAISGLLARALPVFSAANPDVVLEIHEVSMDEIPQLVAANRVDVIVCREPASPPEGYEFLPVLEDCYVVVCSIDHPLARQGTVSDDQLAACRWLITPLTGISPRALEELFARIGGTPRTCNVSSRSVILTRAMLESADLLALVPYSFVRTLVEERALALIGTPSITMPPLGLMLPFVADPALAVSRVIESLQTWSTIVGDNQSIADNKVVEHAIRKNLDR